jgi:hypothetical protein
LHGGGWDAKNRGVNTYWGLKMANFFLGLFMASTVVFMVATNIRLRRLER